MIDFLQAAHKKPGVLAGCFQRYLDGTSNDADKSESKLRSFCKSDPLWKGLVSVT